MAGTNLTELERERGRRRRLLARCGAVLFIVGGRSDSSPISPSSSVSTISALRR